MNLGIKITLDEVRPSVAKAIAGLNPQGIARLHRKIGRRLVILVRDHLLEYAQSHHKTADKLGAQPTGFWSTAVESVSMPTALQTDEHSARLELAGPGRVRQARPAAQPELDRAPARHLGEVIHAQGVVPQHQRPVGTHAAFQAGLGHG